MSGNQPPTLSTVTLVVPPPGSPAKPQIATFPIGIENSDGTPPEAVPDNNLIVTAAVTGPNADGTYTGVATAQAGGVGQSTNVRILADGIVDVIIPFSLVEGSLETASVDPTKIVVSTPS